MTPVRRHAYDADFDFADDESEIPDEVFPDDEDSHYDGDDSGYDGDGDDFSYGRAPECFLLSVFRR